MCSSWSFNYKTAELGKQLLFNNLLLSYALMDCFLVLRGIKTLHLRRHCENGEKVAEFLNNHPKVKRFIT
jgi:cystathionine beta-lyase